MRSAGLHDVGNRCHIAISWHSYAARVHDQYAVYSYDARYMGVPAQNNASGANALKPFTNGVLSIYERSSRTHIFEQVFEIPASGASVTSKNLSIRER